MATSNPSQYWQRLADPRFPRIGPRVLGFVSGPQAQYPCGSQKFQQIVLQLQQLLSSLLVMHLNINELLSEVARLTENLTFADGRVAEALNERNVRYYVTLGVVRPPVREGNKSYYTQDHVLDLVRVRRAQHEGLSLKLIGRPIVNRVESQHSVAAWRSANSPALRKAALAPMALYQTATNEVGWMLRISETILLSGFGAAPDDSEIADVKHALRRHIANSPESETINPTKEENQ